MQYELAEVKSSLRSVQYELAEVKGSFESFKYHILAEHNKLCARFEPVENKFIAEKKVEEKKKAEE